MGAKETRRWTEVCIAVMLVFALAGLPPAGATEPEAPSLADVGFRMASAVADDGAGFAVAVGDFDGDGVPDLAVGAPCDSTNAPTAGAVYILYGPITPGRSLADADATLLGTRAGDFAGEFLTALDMNGDGTDDLVVGVPGPFLGAGPGTGDVLKDSCFGFGPVQPGINRPGEAHVIRGGARLAGAHDTPDVADTIITGLTPLDFTSYGLGGADLDGDGRDELVVGASGPGGGPGQAFLFSGDLPDRISTLEADAHFVGEAPADAFAFSIASGDVDGDGIDDLVIAAPIGFGHPARPSTVYVFLGGTPRSGVVSAASADIRIEGEPGDRASGLEVADLTGNGVADLMIGARAPGIISIFHGPIAARGVVSMSEADVRIDAGPGRNAGAAITVLRDADSAELIVGADADATGGELAGATHRLPASLSGHIDAAAAGTLLVGQPGDMAGFSLATGDLTGNGLDDLVVGAPALLTPDKPGAVYIIPGG